jgi:hypothetical protein
MAKIVPDEIDEIDLLQQRNCHAATVGCARP